MEPYRPSEEVPATGIYVAMSEDDNYPHGELCLTRGSRFPETPGWVYVAIQAESVPAV